MVMQGSGWTCTNCGVFVPMNQSHTCRTVPSYEVTPTYTAKPIRYRVKGRISSVPYGGKLYDVDLVIEPIP